MKIGIIGAGNIGGTLTRRFRVLGHDVFVANSRGPDSLRDLATETGAKPVTAEEAARSDDVVIVTIPEGKIPQLQQLGRPVIKAFNNIYAQHLLERGKPAGTPGRIALPIAGDDAQAKAVVMELVDELGFDPVDKGGLDESWRQQPGTAVYGTDFDANGVRDALARARNERTAQWRGTAQSPGSYEAPA